MLNSYEAKPDEEIASPPLKKRQRTASQDDMFSKLQSQFDHLEGALATCGPHTACGMRCDAMPPLDIAPS